MVKCECSPIFDKFSWEDLVRVKQNELPSGPGVYAIRTRRRGKSIDKVICCAERRLFGEIDWPPFKEFVLSRLQRLKEIGKCPVIYVGAAPTSLQTRFSDLCGRRHTAFYPIWALLRDGWKLDYGWVSVRDKKAANNGEKSLKHQYREIHHTLPALVKR